VSRGENDARTLACAALDAAVDKSLPKEGDDLRSCLFRFARELKAHPQTVGVAAERLRPFTERWHARAVELGHEEWSAELVHWCFSEVWGTVQFAAGADVVGACAERAENGSLPACALKFDDSRMRLLVGLCCQLQRVHGDSEFFLSCRDAGRVLGVRHEEAALMLRVLASDDVGILRVTKRPPRGSPKAIRYLFRGEV
jgi:hypothetical protein